MSSSQKYATPSKRNGKKAKKDQRMDMVPSISRSSGLEKDGDALKNTNTQEEYWSYVQSKISDYQKRYPEGCPESKSREEARHSVLVLIRKLREGIMSTKRRDQFASEVYETSLRISVLFSSATNTTSTLSYLLPTYYAAPPSSHCRDSTILITLLSQLDSFYPSQQGYYRYRQEFLTSGRIGHDSPIISWLASLAGAIRSSNYYKMEVLTRPKAYMPLLGSIPEELNGGAGDLNTPTMRLIISSLRGRLRDRSWPILRTAYREITCLPKVTETSEWLKRSLILDSPDGTVEIWFKQQLEKGNIKVKEGMEGKWIIIKPAPS